MTTVAPKDVDSQVREVTDREVADYQAQGWVLLPGLLSAPLAAEMLAHVKQASGLDYDTLPRDHPDAGAIKARFHEHGMPKLFIMPRLQDQLMWDLASSRALGRASARLAGIGPMLMLSDGVLCKLPEWTGEVDMVTGPAKGTITGATPWHQDFVSLPLDRAGGIQLWLALCEITPEMGSMQYLTGSHRERPLGGVQYGNTGQTMEGNHPELWEKYELSPPLHLQAGDVIAHDSLVVHAAQRNTTDRLRWAHHSFRTPADTLNTGAPFSRFTDFGFDFKQWTTYEHPKFPVVSD
jgi:hypothetical protein